MLGLKEGNCNKMSSLHSISKSKLDTVNLATDFTFCDIPKNICHEKLDAHENHPAFPTSSSPTTRLRRITEERKRLMEMINDLPESCYELSLKDIVVGDHESLQLATEKGIDSKPELREKKKIRKKSPISRSVSLDSGVFLLKIFVPGSLGSKKKATTTRSSSMDGSMKRNGEVEWWKMWFFVGNKGSVGSSNGSTSSGATATKTRYATRMLKDGCWFINPTSQRGCLF